MIIRTVCRLGRVPLHPSPENQSLVCCLSVDTEERERDQRLLSAAICYFGWIISNADKQVPTVFVPNVFKHFLLSIRLNLM